MKINYSCTIKLSLITRMRFQCYGFETKLNFKLLSTKKTNDHVRKYIVSLFIMSDRNIQIELNVKSPKLTYRSEHLYRYVWTYFALGSWKLHYIYPVLNNTTTVMLYFISASSTRYNHRKINYLSEANQTASSIHYSSSLLVSCLVLMFCSFSSSSLLG